MRPFPGNSWAYSVLHSPRALQKQTFRTNYPVRGQVTASMHGGLRSMARNSQGHRFTAFLHGVFRRPRSQTKNMPPTNPVTMPMGMSSGAITVRAAMSAHSRKMAPARAEHGRTRR